MIKFNEHSAKKQGYCCLIYVIPNNNTYGIVKVYDTEMQITDMSTVPHVQLPGKYLFENW